MNSVKDLQRNIKRKNMLITLLIFVLLLTSFISLFMLSKQQEKNAEIINLAGSQRMLSQRIAYFSYLHFNNLTINIVDQTIHKKLSEAANTFSKNQKLLTTLSINESGLIPKNVSLMYFNEPKVLNARINNYFSNAIELSKTTNKDKAQILIKTHFEQRVIDELLIDLDIVVSEIEKHVNKRIEISKTIQLILWLVTVLLLVISTFWVFLPLQKAINKNYHRLYQLKKHSSELNFSINKHAIVFRITIGETTCITEVNKRFLDFYCYDEEEVIGTSVLNICGEGYSLEYFDNIIKECAENEYWDGETLSRIKGGRELWLNSTIVPFKNDNNEVESYIVIQNDISGIKHTELVLNQLHTITSNQNLNLPDKIQEILQLGKQIFNLPLAIISEINKHDYTILYCDTPDNEVSVGDVFDLSNTYCVHTLKADRVIAFHHAGKTDIKTHPCYKNFGLESYIGVPLVVDDKPFGTLNFSSPESSPREFSSRELDLVQLFAHWISTEITRCNNEHELLEQQFLMEQISKQARIGMWEVDLVEDTIYWSKVTKEIHEVSENYEPDLATAISFYKEGKSRSTIEKLVTEAIKNGTSYDVDLQLVTAKGNDIWVSARGRSVYENGRCIKLFGSFQDITDKVSAQYEKSAHNHRITLAADSAGIGIWEHNLISNEIKWDDWMYKLYGSELSKSKITPKAWEDSIHPDDKDQTFKAMRKAINNKDKFDSEYRLIWPDGSVKHIKASAMCIYDELDKPISLIGVNYDITDRVINEVALTKAKVEAEVAVKAKSEFFASMSHEIRTPMNGVLGMLDLLNGSKLTHEQSHYTKIAQQSATSLLSLINDILDFSKIDANKLELENICFNLIEMVGNLAESFAPQTQNKNIELVLDLSQVKESLIVGDSNRIRQVLTNLLSNSIKFTSEGEVTLRLSQKEHSSSHWCLMVEVIDTGIGIPKDKQKTLFEAFSQVDASTTRQYGGTGLGLAIVKKLCACMQGSIKVESQLGKGTVFTCELLLEKSPVQQFTIPENAIQKKHVLVIENNESCGKSIERQLTSWNVNTTLINNGKEALTYLNANTVKIDLILMNKDMPNEDTLAFVKKVRANPELLSLKIMLMTLMTNQDELSNHEELGINGHFPKPVTMADLYHALNITVEEALPDKNTTVLNEVKPLAQEGISWKEDVQLLLVEDNRVNQMVAKGVLKKLGINNVTVAVNGIDAINQLNERDKDEPFNFIFMDCQMPEMDGYEATQKIREGDASDQYKEVPIVAMTANAMIGDEQKCLEAGMNDYLVKPIDKDKIYTILQKYVNTQNA